MHISDATRQRLETRLGFPLPAYRLPYEQFRTDYGVGIVGLHWVMQIMQLPAYRAARFNIVGAAEINDAAVRTAVEKRLIPDAVDRDYRELIRRDDVQIVDSCFGHKPEKEHKKLELVEACAAAGKPVQVHKPAASTLGVAEKMLQVSEQSGVPVCVNQNCRYNPAAYSVKQLLAPERLGRPLIIELQHYWRGDPKPADDDRPGVMQHVIHHADLLRWWVDARCTRVYARCQQGSTLAIYSFDNGTTVYHMENHSGVEHHDNHFRIQTERAIIHGKHNWDWHLGNAEGRDKVAIYLDTREPAIELPLPMLPYEPIWSDINKWMPHEGPWYDLSAPTAGMMGCLGSVMQGLSEGREPTNHLRGGVESLRIALAAEISGRTGKPVDPRDVPSDYTTITEPPA